MLPTELSSLRERLIQMRREYLDQIADLTVGDQQVPASDPAHDGGVSDDPADDADAVYEAEKNEALANFSRDQMDLVEAALARMDAGTYGTCLDCGQPIDPRRLDVLPFAQYCLADQPKHE